VDDRELDRIEAVILSMTPEERRRPELIKALAACASRADPARACRGQPTDQAVRPDAHGDAPVGAESCPTWRR